MKIVFADYYKNRKEVPEIDSLIDIPSNDIFRYVDEMGVNKVYENFERHYAEAENIYLPGLRSMRTGQGKSTRG
jgi:transposase